MYVGVCVCGVCVCVCECMWMWMWMWMWMYVCRRDTAYIVRVPCYRRELRNQWNPSLVDRNSGRQAGKDREDKPLMQSVRRDALRQLSRHSDGAGCNNCAEVQGSIGASFHECNEAADATDVLYLHHLINRLQHSQLTLEVEGGRERGWDGGRGGKGRGGREGKGRGGREGGSAGAGLEGGGRARKGGNCGHDLTTPSTSLGTPHSICFRSWMKQP